MEVNHRLVTNLIKIMPLSSKQSKKEHNLFTFEKNEYFLSVISWIFEKNAYFETKVKLFGKWTLKKASLGFFFFFFFNEKT